MRKILAAIAAAFTIATTAYAEPICEKYTCTMQAPQELGEIVEDHVQSLFDKGYAKDLSQDDLFHGHFLGGNSKYIHSNLNKFLSSIQGLLYHTDESTKRWEKGELTSRSIIGYNNGDIFEAEYLVDPTKQSSFCDKKTFELYPEYGTIHQSDIAKTYPSYDAGGLGSCPSGYIPAVKIDDKTYGLITQFEIVTDPNGKYSVNEFRFNVLLNLIK